MDEDRRQETPGSKSSLLVARHKNIRLFVAAPFAPRPTEWDDTVHLDAMYALALHWQVRNIKLGESANFTANSNKVCFYLGRGNYLVS